MKTILKSKSFMLDVIFIFLGCLLASLGVNLFLTHARLLSGGATGLALIVQYLADVPAGVIVFLLNVPLFILSFKKLSPSFTLYSGIGMLSLSASLIITKPLSNLVQVNDVILYCLYGGALCGAGYGIVFLRNGSTGGTDIITMLIRKKYSNFEIGKLGFYLNCIIVIIGALIFGLPKALYTLLSIFVQGLVLDKVLKGLNSRKLMLILTDKHDEVVDFVLKDLHRGVTSLHAEGEYTHEQKKMLYCIVTTREMLNLKNKIYSVDDRAFITIMDISEVKGKGFKNI